MTPIPVQAKRETLAGGLNQALSALRSLGALSAQVGEQSALTSRFTLAVNSAAEVDMAAAKFGAEAAWTLPWAYQATRQEGAVTVTVSFCLDPRTALATAATIDAFCSMAASNGPGCTA